jgi:hypothetical protein
VQNDLKQTQSIFDASAFLADLLARYASTELHYGDPEIDDWSQLQECVISVYTAILQYTFAVNDAWKSGLHSTLLTTVFIRYGRFTD